MKRWRVSLLLAGVALVSALPASSQESPESLLPPGFGEPTQPQPRPQQPARPTPATSQPSPEAPRSPASPVIGSPPAGSTPTALPGLEELDVATVSDAELEALLAAAQEAQKPTEDLPEWARRSPQTVGPLLLENGGFTADGFGRTHGVFLATLVDRLDAPIASRWGSILLRRAMLSHIPAPIGVDPVNWVAARAALMLRMGEADGARLLVQAVDVDRFTPKMMDVAADTALATADPAALCPLTERAKGMSDRPIWPLAEAMCAALEGEASRASALLDQQRKRSNAGNIDLLLAEKVVGAGANTRRAVTIEWDPVDRLDHWRFGLASATGLVVPDRLMDGAGPSMRAWQARAPMLPLEQRLAAYDVAASLGVFSSRSLVELYSLIGDGTDPAEWADTVPDRLRRAFAGRTIGDRMTALRELWNVETTVQRQARLILTAAAAGRIPPSPDLQADAPALLASMLSAGLDRPAARWASVLGEWSGSDANAAWALLALGAPRSVVDLSAGRIEEYADADDSTDAFKTRLLVAGLAGLGRISEESAAGLAGDAGLRLDRRNRWTMMIDNAARHQQPATVALLAAVGMQTGDWRGVPPEYLFHIVRALRQVGMDYEGRMIAAEALARL